MFSNLRSLIFKLDPETVHNLAIKSLKFNFVPNIFKEREDEKLFETYICYPPRVKKKKYFKKQKKYDL